MLAGLNVVLNTAAILLVINVMGYHRVLRILDIITALMDMFAVLKAATNCFIPRLMVKNSVRDTVIDIKDTAIHSPKFP